MKYPEMRPAESLPTLFTVHGIGTGLYGSRDVDGPTGTFVQTQCFCVFYVPLLALAAYRLARQGTGYTLVGRVPLSRFAKTWNLLFVFSVLAAIAWGLINGYLNSAEYQAGRDLARADEAADAGDLLEAARLYREVADSRTGHAAAARARCAKLIERPEIDRLPLRDVGQIFDEVLQSRAAAGNSPALLGPRTGDRERPRKAEPAAAVEFLGHVARLSLPEACQTFVELVKGPCAALAPAETVAMFREAVSLPEDDDQKAAMAGLGVEQCRRLAAIDLPAAMALLAIVAPLGDRPAVNKCLADLLGSPLEKSRCAEVAKVLRTGREFADAAAEKELFQAGIAWVERHPQAGQQEVLDLLDQLADLSGADQARIAAVRRPMLEKLVAASPQDAELSVQLALALEAEGSAEGEQGENHDPGPRIIKLLTPLRDKLGSGEGARLLGQALAAQGKFDESYALLTPYLDQRLDAFHEAEQAYEKVCEEVAQRVGQQLRDGTAPGFDFRRGRAAGESQWREMAMEYLARQMKADASLRAAQEKLAKQGMVVPAALEMGMVMLQRAQSMKDAAARRTELERAEKTFLAIRGTAGESDRYLLQLGQVYYWLGKQQEGRAEFDKLLAKHQRKAEILYSLANVLRDLGATAEARKLMEEAYNKARDEAVRHAVAHLRAITSTGLDDEIQWLERCDPRDENTQALLARSRGACAEAEGKDDEAAANYRQAVAIYQRQPESAATLNNGAMASLALFEITGDRQAQDRGEQWLEKAVKLSPTDPVGLSNAAAQTLTDAIQDLAGADFNLHELQMSGHVGTLYFLVNDQKGLDEVRRRARQHPGLRKGLGYLDRVNVLAPKNVNTNLLALAMYGFLRDREALERPARQVAASKPDVEDYKSKTLKYYAYQDEDFTKEKMQAKTARAEAVLKRLSARAKGPAFAAAVERLQDLRLGSEDAEAVDADEIVRLAEEAHHAAPSMATCGLLIKALMCRASKTLAAAHPEYAKAIQGCGRAAADDDCLALAMARDDALGKTARENKDVQRAVALVVARAEAFPESRGGWDWAVLGAAGPGQAGLRAKCLARDEFDSIEREIRQSLVPISTGDALDTYWRRVAAGGPEPREPLDELAKLGVPLPVGLIEVDAEKRK